jgi:hypothetical protein
LAQGFEAAGEMLQRLCCAALLGSPAVALIDDSVDESVLNDVDCDVLSERH